MMMMMMKKVIKFTVDVTVGLNRTADRIGCLPQRADFGGCLWAKQGTVATSTGDDDLARLAACSNFV